MIVANEDRRARIEAGLGAVLVHALLGAAFLWGLGVPFPRVIEEKLDVFNVSPPPPEPVVLTRPPPPRPSRAPSERRRNPGREGAAAPPNLRSQATQIVVPPPIVPLPLPPPITAAPVAGVGSQSSQGAAEVRGPGFGAGGIGDGRGSGYGGDGDGGGGDGLGSPPRRIRGRLSDRDYPQAAWEAGAGGTVSVLFTITIEGRAVDCRITRSSGSRLLDMTTCDLIERRYRFEPSRDRRGRAISARMAEDHEWVTYDEPPEPRGRDW